jgi:hypothetical protein
VIRRSFRFGLTLGLLGGLAFALVKMFGPRPDAQPAAAPSPSAPWPRLTADPAVPAAATTSLVADPDAPAAPRHAAAFQPAPVPAAEEPAATPAAAAEAVADPAAVSAPAPVAAPVAKRAAPKKAAPDRPTGAAAPAKVAKIAKAPKTAKKKPLVAPWVDPTDGVCPTTHPVKGKLASKIFHLPGMLNYARTTPDRCYRDAPAAEADGLRPAKR